MNILVTGSTGLVGSALLPFLTAGGNRVARLVRSSTPVVSCVPPSTVYVDDDLTIPGPTLQVAPKQLGWHFDIGDTTPQTATLAIANIGSGTFDWVAGSDAPWLSFSSHPKC